MSVFSISTECRRNLLVNVDFPGTDIASLFSADAEHCQLLCTPSTPPVSSSAFFALTGPETTGTTQTTETDGVMYTDHTDL